MSYLVRSKKREEQREIHKKSKGNPYIDTGQRPTYDDVKMKLKQKRDPTYEIYQVGSLLPVFFLSFSSKCFVRFSTH